MPRGHAAAATTAQAARATPRPLFTERPRPGIQFSEAMCGRFLWAGGGHDHGPENGIEPWTAAAADPSAAPIGFDVTVLADDVERFVSASAHDARLIGTVTAASLSDTPMTIRDGRFTLFIVDPDRVETRYMCYRMTVTSSRDVVYRLEGMKIVRKGSWRTLWAALTTLYVTLDEAGTGRWGRGTLRRSAGDVVGRLASLRPMNARGFAERLDARARLIGFFLGVVRSTYGGPLARAVVSTVDAPSRPPRPVPVRPETYDVETSDTTRIHLTRYHGGDRGPVMLAPGFSVSAASFAADTVDENLVERLLRVRYDVWLFDYRASSSFPAAGTSFSIDDVALRDYPAAVARILEETGRRDLQIVAHCVGAMALLMSLLAGQLQGQVRSAICSQLGLHPIAPRLAEIKASLLLASLLRWAGIATVSADFNPYRLTHRLTDKLLALYPTGERCNNPACRRILLLLGESFRHARLNTATHDTIADWFGTASVSALAHLSLMLRAGHVVDRDGRATYLTDRNLARLKLPISFIHGTRNREFLPRSTRKTYRELRRVNGRGWYRRILVQGYGHMDCFIGRDAARDVFPIILRELKGAPGRRD